MVFCQLKQFNLALLAKQGWRLQTQQESLVYQVYKAKYFPLTDFIHASLSTNPSYTWRSIMAAHHLMQKGIHWNVGNGESIRVWEDKWLPSPSTFKVTSPRQFLHAETRVSELISYEKVAWKTQIIEAIFLPHEAKLIKIIPLSIRLPEDKLVWAATPNGLFSVRNAYKLVVEDSQPNNRGASSDNNKNHRFWKLLWSL